LKPDIQEHKRIREYLLGQSAPDDSTFVEEMLLTDDEFYQQLLIIEDELVDRYLAGLLTDPERESFENYFLAAPERREKLRFARNLKKYVNRAKGDRTSVADYSKTVTDRHSSPAPVLQPKRVWPRLNPILSYSLAAAAVVALTIAGIVIFRAWNSTPHTGKALAVELVPGISRGEEGIKQITVPTDIATVQLQLKVSNISAYQTYRAILETANGREISRQDDLRSDPAFKERIISLIPADLLKPGDYSLKLSGLNRQGEFEDVARYNFRVTK
jgi:hypothetical protein